MTSPAPSPTRSSPSWLVAILIGVIGLLLGAGIALAITFGVQAAHATKNNGATSAQVAAANRKYEKALFDCSLDQSPFLKINAKAGILTAASGASDGTGSGLAASSLHCVIQSLGASGTVLEQLDRSAVAPATPATQTVAIGSLTLRWASQSDGSEAAVVSPTPSK
jgi:hypothetical protein